MSALIVFQNSGAFKKRDVGTTYITLEYVILFLENRSL